MEQFDFIAIGDTVVDDFLRLKDAHVTCRIDNTACEIAMPFGSKVPFEYDKIIYAVGNSANAAVAASRLGLKSALIANIGNDDNGEKCLAALKENHVDTSLIVKQEGKKTNYHYVLWFGDERTILIKHESYDYKLPEFTAPKYLYLSSLGDHTENYHDQIADTVEKMPNTKLIFQPGTFQIKLGQQRLERIYKRADVFFCNKEEAMLITKIDKPEIPTLAKAISGFGPKMVMITDGKNGAYLYENGEMKFMPPYPDEAPPLERTGAGDAFASTFSAGLALGLSSSEALKWAAVNSMSVVHFVGAQEGLLTQEKIKEYLENAPEDFGAMTTA